LRADVRDQIPLVISEPVLSKKILALRCEVPIHMDGENGHVLVKLFVINAPWFPDLSDVAPSGCLSHDGLTEQYRIVAAPASWDCVPMSAIKFRSSFQNLFYQRRYWLSDARYRCMDGEEGGTTYFEAFRDQLATRGSPDLSDVAPSHLRLPWPLTALTNDTASRCALAPVLPELRADHAIKFLSFQNLFIKEDIGYPDAVPIHGWERRGGTWSRT
jgi:hypothetical protein